MADRRAIVLALLLFIFILLPDNGGKSALNQTDDLPTAEHVIATERRMLGLLQNATYGEPKNLTGLEADNGYVWSAMPQVRQQAKEQFLYALGADGERALANGKTETPLFRNITGYVLGQWVHSDVQKNITIPHLNLTHYGTKEHRSPRKLGRNMTSSYGQARFRFHEKDLEKGLVGWSNVTGITADMALQETDIGPEYSIQLYGVHFKDVGQIILSTTSNKFAGIFMLPHFALTSTMFEGARALLNVSISRVVEAQDSGQITSINPWASRSSETENFLDSTNCELIVYLQQQTTTTTVPISFLESELRSPTGAIMPSLPDLRFSMLAFSPDCGYVLESKGEPRFAPQEGNHLVGAKNEVLYDRGRHHLLIFGASIGCQLVLLTRQMREANTPSTRSRISYYTIAMLGMGDGFAAIAFIMLSSLLDHVWINLASAAFLALVSIAFFGMRFMMEVWNAQAPERERRARERAEEIRQGRERLEAALEESGSSQSAERSPSPSNQQDEPAVFMPSDQEGLAPVAAADAGPEDTVAPRTASFGSLYARFYFVLLVVFFLTLNAISWSPVPRSRFFASLVTLYLSFWIPQIYRNAYRNCRRALTWEFVLGQSVLRLVPIAYFYLYPQTVLFTKPRPWTMAFLALWMWVQIVLLASQELLDPRWLVKQSWVPPAYDYYPLLRDDEEGVTMPVGWSDATPSTPLSPVQSLNTPAATGRCASLAKDVKNGERVFDCAICMQEFAVPVAQSGSESSRMGTGLLARGLRRNYMVTPCRHIFHSACLEGWMKFRLQCPICREVLPPL
ncbi:hypothetical protein K470DRAFT_255518 [Piedraia hortae CBS 480.64]|uniref:DSC E3 ubiquitin ligase complex subunit A n=1 Tax=Piedraia hortae CBS 480.64 TaxID=1314780 RepID=A0A6A7C6J8_9PEZI|nr:hypothetical protein K470DRAFT_255518 [Piedraia hortae CBS 480.64]